MIYSKFSEEDAGDYETLKSALYEGFQVTREEYRPRRFPQTPSDRSRNNDRMNQPLTYKRSGHTSPAVRIGADEFGSSRLCEECRAKEFQDEVFINSANTDRSHQQIPHLQHISSID